MTAGRQLVVFSIGGEQYALPIEAVSEIIRYTTPHSVASSSPWAAGVIALRGKVIPIFDLAARLGIDRAGEPGTIVVVERDGVQVGVSVDEVDEVVTLAADRFQEIPAANAEAIEAVAKLDDRLVVLLRPAGCFLDA
jgi:purine-binding chemotaxis protein CheW